MGEIDIDDVFWILRKRGTNKVAWDYNFEMPNAKNSNDNGMLVVFNDGSCNRHDAEISAERHFQHLKPYNWKHDWDLIPVRLTECKDDGQPINALV